MFPQVNHTSQFTTSLPTTFAIQYRQQDLYPYTKKQFLGPTFNYNTHYIQGFLALPHETKLKMYLLVEEAKIYGKITDKQGYQQILTKIAHAVKILKGQSSISEQSTNNMEDKINQLCDYEFNKLQINDHWKPLETPEHTQQIKSASTEYDHKSKQIIVSPKANHIEVNFNTFNQQIPNNDEEDFDQFIEVVNQQKIQQQQCKIQDDKKSDEDWEWAGEENQNNNRVNLPQLKITQEKANIPTFDELIGVSLSPREPQLPPMNFAWMGTFTEQEKYKQNIFDINIDEDDYSSKNNQKVQNILQATQNQTTIKMQSNSIPIHENIIQGEEYQQQKQLSIENNLSQAVQDDEQFLQFVSENATVAETNSTHTGIATSVSTGLHHIISGISINPSHNQLEAVNDIIPMNSNNVQQSKQQSNVLDLNYLGIMEQNDYKINSEPMTNGIEKTKSVELWNQNNSNLMNSCSEKQDTHILVDDKNNKQQLKNVDNNLVSLYDLQISSLEQTHQKKIQSLIKKQQGQIQSSNNKQVQKSFSEQGKKSSDGSQFGQFSQPVEIPIEMPVEKSNNDKEQQQISNHQPEFNDKEQEQISNRQPEFNDKEQEQIFNHQREKKNLNNDKCQQQLSNKQPEKNQSISLSHQIQQPIRIRASTEENQYHLSLDNEEEYRDNQIFNNGNQSNEGHEELMRSQNLNFTTKSTSMVSNKGIPNAEKTDYINKNSFTRKRKFEHPLLKPLLIKYDTIDLQRQIVTNTFQCNEQFYEKALEYIRELGYTNSPIEKYLEQQLSYTHKIKQFTEMYTTAVEEDEQQKVKQALKKSKQFYGLLNGTKTINWLQNFFDRLGRGILYQLSEIVLESGVSIQYIDKFINIRNTQNFLSNLVTLYIFQKNNNIESIPVYANNLVKYFLLQFENYRNQQHIIQQFSYSQQQTIITHQKYVIYIIGLGKIASICKRMIALMKICSKGTGNLVKCLKACKQLQLASKQLSEQIGRHQSVLWTQQQQQLLIPRQYFECVISAIKQEQINQILPTITNTVRLKPVCRLCFGSVQLEEMNGTKIHSECWNLYRKVTQTIKQ